MAEPTTQILFTLLGGTIGFASSVGILLLRFRREDQAKAKRRARLGRLLYEEVEQAAELLAIDLKIPTPVPLEVLLDDEGDNARRFRNAVQRIRVSRVIFEAHSGELIDLPGYTPNAVVRFYNRLQLHCGALDQAIDDQNIDAVEKHRDAALEEAKILKVELLEIAKTAPDK